MRRRRKVRKPARVGIENFGLEKGHHHSIIYNVYICIFS